VSRPGAAAAALLAVVLAGCNRGAPVQARPTALAISQECRSAFEAAAIAGANASEDPAPVSMSRLYPTITACHSVEEWAEGYRGHPLPGLGGFTAVNVLRELCENADESDVAVRSSPVCLAVAV
jgi:hypothetical protein